MENDLGIAAGAEPVAPLLQLTPELEEVVELSVVDDAPVPALVPYRLMTALQINNAESRHAQRHADVTPYASVVGSSMPQRIDGAIRAATDAALRGQRYLSVDATHGLILISCS